MIGYQAQVLPAILAAFTLCYLEKFFRKITPQVISMVVVPFCSLLLSVVAAHFILGPIGWKIGSAISSVVYAGITGSFKVVFGAVFGFVYAPLVITGLHHMTNAIDLQLIADYEGTMLWPMIALSNIAQGSAVLGMIWLQKKDARAQEVNVPACISCYLGVTEPAIFGVNLKHMFPFICGMIGSACAGVVCVAAGVTANAIGVGGLPGILSIKPVFMPMFAVCMAIAVAVPFLLTAVVGKKKGLAAGNRAMERVPEESGSQEGGVSGGSRDENVGKGQAFRAFLDGTVIPLKEVGDGVFSEGIMGEGLAVRPENDTVTSPGAGTVIVMMEDSRHAVGLLMDNGIQLLIHVGIDTVDMKGDGFAYLVKQGERVSAGSPLIRFDREKIKKAGHPDVTVCVVTDAGEAENIRMLTGMRGTANETEIMVFE